VSWVTGKAESEQGIDTVSALINGKAVPVLGKTDWLLPADSLTPKAWNTVIITATNTAGNSSRDTVYLFRKPALDSLRGLEFSVVGGTSISLRWHSVRFCDRFIIYESDSAGSWTIAAPAHRDTTFIDTGLLPRTMHRYRVQAYYVYADTPAISDSTPVSRTDSARTMTAFQKVFGGSEDEYGRSVRLTKDSSYIVVGGSLSFGAGTAQGYAIKVGRSGDTVWTKLVNGVSINSVLQLADGRIAVCGTSSGHCAGCPPGSSLIFTTIDSSGASGQIRSYRPLTYTTGMSIAQAHNGNVIACGTLVGFREDQGHLAYYSELNSSGDTLWMRPKLDWLYDSIQVPFTDAPTEGNAVVAVNGGYIVAGRWKQSPTVIGGGSRPDLMWAAKVGLQGETIWTDTIGGVKYACGYAADVSGDGACVIAGETAVNVAGADTNVLIAKVYLDGTTAWTREIGSSAAKESARSIRSTPDGGFIITGGISTPANGSDLYVVKITANGDTVWTRTFGGTGDECGYSIDNAADGGYIITGETTSVGAGKKDLYLIKTDAQGKSVAAPD
jgi:hypothetical protein